MKIESTRGLAALRRQSNDELDALAALELAGAVVADSPTDLANAYADGKITVRRAGRSVTVQTADDRWSPSRDIAVASHLESLIRRRRLQRTYVTLLIELVKSPAVETPAAQASSRPASLTPPTKAAGPKSETTPVAGDSDHSALFELISATPRQRTLAAILAAREQAIVATRKPGPGSRPAAENAKASQSPRSGL